MGTRAVSRSPEATILVERQVRTLLALAPAYQRLPPDEQRQIAEHMVKIGAYLVRPEGFEANALLGAVVTVPAPESMRDFLEEVNFPAFVAGLITGVFQAIVDSSIQQMEAYSELLKSVAETVDQFADDNITENQARDWLAATYRHYLERDAESGALRLRAEFDRAQALKRFRMLPLPCPLRKLEPSVVEKILVPAAKRRIAATRQQLLASMVLMGVNR